MTSGDVDVAIVGFGPVGQALAGLLGRAGHRVAVFERHAENFQLPRAVRLDGEAMRLFQRLGIAGDFGDAVLEVDAYHWFGADGDPMLTLDLTPPSPTGWRTDYTFYQPAIEAVLSNVGPSMPNVTLHRGWSATALRQDAEAATLTVTPQDPRVPGAGGPHDVRAKYVVGADGAGSAVRALSGIGWDDSGFSEQWVVVDVRPHDPEAFAHIPSPAQHCDPRRPHTVVRNGTTHRRWEFKLLDGELPSDFEGNPEKAWELVHDYITPEQGELVRATTYEFRSLLANQMDAGRVLLAGDAAHLMPPFMGEGMCTGLRDAANLSWRLDLVLRGVSRPELLRSYSTERTAQNTAIVGVSIAMGQMACLTDPEAAAQRDAAFRSGQVPPPPPLPALGPGVRRGEHDPVAGRLAVLGEVERGGLRGRFGDVVGEGFAVICSVGDPEELISPEARAALADLGAKLVTFDASVAEHLRDVSGVTTVWMRDHGLEAVVTRPDGYAFGGCPTSADLGELIEELRTALALVAHAAVA